VNETIRESEVRVIDEAGKQLGIMNTNEALRMAEMKGLDLVEVSPNANPPVCRLMDYGKYVYERAKREREARKAQKVVEVKEIRVRPKTGDHDVAFKLRNARQFLLAGSKVKVRVVFRGREITHPEVGRELLDEIVQALSDVAVVEQRARSEGRSMIMILAPSVSK
jgi:translation initiation factor IF-3